MTSFLKLLYLIVTLQICYIKTADSTTDLPGNGTFVFTEYEDKICSKTKVIQGFIPKADYWKVQFFGQIIKPVSFNANISRLTYKECNSGPSREYVCGSEKDEVCINECTEKTGISPIYYSCNFIPTSNLSLFTFTGYDDSGCNNNNGLKYPLPLSTACWKLEGEGSMHMLSFIERRMTVNVYASNNCQGTIKEYKKGFECDESCIENPINIDMEYYQCKFTSSTTLQYSLISFLIIYLAFLI